MDKQMKRGLRITLLVYVIYSVVYGLLHVIVPEKLGAVDPAIERVLGAAVLGFALGAWFAYKEKSWEKAQKLVLVQIVWLVLYTITMVWGLLAGAITTMAWSSAIIGTVFALLLLVFYIKEGNE